MIVSGASRTRKWHLDLV